MKTARLDNLRIAVDKIICDVDKSGYITTLDEIGRAFVIAALEENEYKIKTTARYLRIDRRRLYYLIEKFVIPMPSRE